MLLNLCIKRIYIRCYSLHDVRARKMNIGIVVINNQNLILQKIFNVAKASSKTIFIQPHIYLQLKPILRFFDYLNEREKEEEQAYNSTIPDTLTLAYDRRNAISFHVRTFANSIFVCMCCASISRYMATASMYGARVVPTLPIIWWILLMSHLQIYRVSYYSFFLSYFFLPDPIAKKYIE